MIDRSQSDVDQYKGQFIAAGYTGHGMPRAFAWLVPPNKTVMSYAD